MKKILIIPLVPLKRVFFTIYKIISIIYKGFIWLIRSKEHTNFSFEIDEKNSRAMKQNLHHFLNLEEKQIQPLIDFANTTEVNKKNYKSIFKTIDLDFRSKWDYRLIPFIILFATDINKVYELGFDQGRLPLLISNHIHSNNIKGKKYIGVDFNTRKGILTSESNFVELHFEPVQDFLSNFKSPNELDNSLLVVSTHEKQSEDFIFDFLEGNLIQPKFIVSDEVGENSAYIKFLPKNNYENITFIFLDKLNFLEPLIIGLSKKI